MEFKTIERTVVEYLRKQIITGQLSAGTKLTENDLATQLDISRHPLREAFRVLESEHLVICVPRKGTYVSEMSIEDLQQLYQAREMIECYAIELLRAQRIRKLPLVVSALETGSGLSIPPADRPEEMLEYLNAFAGYHIRLVESTGNQWVMRFFHSIAFHLARYQCMYLYLPGTRENSLKEHDQILDLIERGSYVQARQQLRSHIRGTFERLKSKIAQRSIQEEKQQDLESTQKRTYAFKR